MVAKARNRLQIVAVGEVRHLARQCMHGQLHVQIADPRAHSFEMRLFGGRADQFWMDHDILLKAKIPVTFGDTKEGAFGIRLNDTLKEAGGSGHYINAEGLESGKVWGVTSPWVAIRGAVKDASGDHDVTVAIFAHPSGLNFPPYWHARDYGLFAVNPFGRKAYDPKAEERTMKLTPGESVHLRYRLSVYSAKVEKTRLDQDAKF